MGGFGERCRRRWPWFSATLSLGGNLQDDDLNLFPETVRRGSGKEVASPCRPKGVPKLPWESALRSPWDC